MVQQNSKFAVESNEEGVWVVDVEEHPSPSLFVPKARFEVLLIEFLGS